VLVPSFETRRRKRVYARLRRAMAASPESISTRFDLTHGCFKAAGFVFMDSGLTRFARAPE